MSKLKLLLFWLFTPLFIGVSFGAYDIFWGLNLVYNSSYSRNSSSSNKTFSDYWLTPYKPYCAIVKNTWWWYALTYAKVNWYNVSNWNIWVWKYFCFSTYMCTNNSCYLSIETAWGPVQSSYSLSIYSLDLPIEISSSDCSSIENDLINCQSSFNTLSWNYASLNSSFTQLEANYNSCMTDTSHCETLVWVCYENLSGCQETNSSLQNYNDSLSQQLNECLENWSWWVWSWIYLSSFDLFWSDEGVNYSLPITNNIFLPYWYRWFLDDGVLAIRNVNSLNSALSLDNSSYQQGVIDNLWKVFLFLMSCGLILVFLYTIRRYFIWLKSIK